MKLAIRPAEAVHALKAIDRRRPSRVRKDLRLALMATADGLVFETNASSAFVTAQVSQGGGCEVGRDALLRILQTFPPDYPLTLAVEDEFLLIGRLRMPAKKAFLSRANSPR